MNESLKSAFTELAAMTQLYMLQEWKLEEWVTSDRETQTFLRSLVKPNIKPPQNQENPAPELVQTKVQSPAPVTKPIIQEKPPIHAPAPALEKQAEPPPIPQKKPQQTAITVEHPQPLPVNDLADIRDIFKNKFPNVSILEPISEITDTNPTVIILAVPRSPSEKQLLLSLAKALEIHGKPTVIQSQPHGQTAKVYIGRKKEVDAIASSTKAPTVCLYDDISLYLKEPALKRMLWREICQHLQYL